jgi:hypothetical protein
MNPNTKLFALFAVLALLYLFFSEKREGMEIGTESAADACKKISSRAEEIKANMGGVQGVVQAALGIFSPKNFGAGDNSTNNTVRNIIETDMSVEDITKIENSCKNVSTGVQSNIIDTTQCDYCQKHGCDIKDVTQENELVTQQKCALQVATELLMNKTNSVDAQALAKVFQESQGLLSGDNEANNDVCNITRTDMSSKEYFEQLSSCANEISQDQLNELKGCGNVVNVIQKNKASRLQDCVINNTVDKSKILESTSKISGAVEATQKSTGITPMASLASGLSSFVVLALAGVGYYLYYQQQQK